MALYLNELKYSYPGILKRRSLQKFSRHSAIKSSRKSYRESQKNEKSFWEIFCERSSIHGIRYVALNGFHRVHKIIWSCVVILAIAATIYVSMILSRRFNDNLLATVVDSTVYPVYEIPFPAITVCNYNRVNWKRIREAEKKFLPSQSDPKLSDIFRRFMAAFHDFEFGNFFNFQEFENTSLKDLDPINLREVADFLSYRCEELFMGKCWWRGIEVSCCELFSKQKTEYGFCYAFNSLTNEVGRRKAKIDTKWPWRTSTSGEWSGLRVEINVDPSDKPPGTKQFSGIKLLVNHPEEWPSDGIFVPAGAVSFAVLRTKLSFLDDETKRLKPERRQCIFQNELKDNGYETLPGLKYLIGNCLSNCRRQYTIRYCNCSIDFFFPEVEVECKRPNSTFANGITKKWNTEHGCYLSFLFVEDVKVCKASDFHCLYKYAGVFSYEKSYAEEKFINSIGQGMICSCVLQCYAIDYKAEVTPFFLLDHSSNPNEILLDVHYQRNTLLKYRTAIVFGWIDLLVGFGGIASFFLGCSLISGFEILYYMMIGLSLYWKQLYSNKIQSQNNFDRPENISNQIFVSNAVLRRDSKNSEYSKNKY